MTEDRTGGQDAPGRDELPLPDYDHLPLPALTSRVRTLDVRGVETLLAYEHARDRLPVVVVLENRLEALRAGATPSEGSPLSPAPERPPLPSASSPVGPATAGPTINPPSHGVPTNPSQPRSTG